MEPTERGLAWITFAEEFALHSDRRESIWPRIIAIALAALLVGAATIVLMAAASAAVTGIHHRNVIFDTVAAPDSAAATLFGIAFLTPAIVRRGRTV